MNVYTCKIRICILIPNDLLNNRINELRINELIGQ